MNGVFWVIGGQGDLKTELCSEEAGSEGELGCEELDDNDLESFAFSPEIFIVPYYFCK